MDITWLHGITQLPLIIYIKWLMLLVPLVLLVAWVWRQERQLRPRLAVADPQLQIALYQMARSRALVVIGLWVMLALTIIVYDVRFMPSEPNRAQLPTVSVAAPEPAIVEVAPRLQSERAKNPGAYLDLLNSRYEDAFLSFFYLRQCRAVDEEDYKDLYTGYRKQVALAGGDSAQVDNTVSAALGSFETIYSGATCDKAQLEPIARQFEAMMAVIRQF